MQNYSFTVVDIETGSLSLTDCAVIEVSMLKLGDTSEDAQRTWWMKPFDTDIIDPGALRVNGHKLDDLMHKTKEGREKYLDPHNVIIDMENWLSLDNMPAERRCIIAQNGSFDKDRLEQLWIKCGSKDSFPFGRRMIDTMIMELFFDFAKDQFADSYSLAALVKKYGVTNTKAHTADANVRATKQVFEKQVEYFRKLLKNG